MDKKFNMNNIITSGKIFDVSAADNGEVKLGDINLVSFIGADMAGVKKPEGHFKADTYCASNGVFIIENLENLDLLLEKSSGNVFKVYRFPINISGFSGLPSRVIAEV